jgi:hypothetical protein
MVHVSLDVASQPGEPVLVLVLLQGPDWVLSLRATPRDLLNLYWIRQADLTARRILQVGAASGARVHWAADGEAATAMVGDDDLSWDYAVTIPFETVDRIVAEVQARFPGHHP